LLYTVMYDLVNILTVKLMYANLLVRQVHQQSS